MSLLRNFSPGGSEPDDDEQPTTAAQPEETARPEETPAPSEETARSGGGHAPGTARYAFSGPTAGTADPVPGTVVPAEVVPGPDLVEEPTPAPAAEAADPEATPPDLKTPAAQEAPSAAFETSAPETVPVPPVQTMPSPVPSPRATGEGEPAASPAAAAGPDPDFTGPAFTGPASTGPDFTGPDFTGPLLRDTALRAQWQRVQGDFVDDPRAAVNDAADLVGQTVETLMEALRLRQRQLRAVWEGSGTADGSPAAAMTPGADTEQLRLMMQRYRALFNQLCRPS